MALLTGKRAALRTSTNLGARLKDLQFSFGMKYFHFGNNNHGLDKLSNAVYEKLTYSPGFVAVRPTLSRGTVSNTTLRPLPSLALVALSLAKKRLSANKRGEKMFAVDFKGKLIAEPDIWRAFKSREIGGLLHYTISPDKFMYVEAMATNPFARVGRGQNFKNATAYSAMEREMVRIARENKIDAIALRTWVFAAHPRLLEHYRWTPVVDTTHNRAVGFFQEYPWAAKVMSGEQLRLEKVGEETAKDALNKLSANDFLIFPEYYLNLRKKVNKKR